MQRYIPFLMAAVCLGVLMVGRVWAGSPHFVTCSVARVGDTLNASGKEAGLGDELQVDIEVTALAECINGGSNHPKAANKESLSAEGQFPVQNGRANFSLVLTPTFSPPCSPPMSIIFTDVSVCDATNSICCSVSGTF